MICRNLHSNDMRYHVSSEEQLDIHHQTTTFRYYSTYYFWWVFLWLFLPFTESIRGNNTNNNWYFVLGFWWKNIKLSWVFSLVIHEESIGSFYDVFHGTFRQILLRVQTHLIWNHCPQGDFDIIGGTSALTEAEVIKVLFSTAYC